MIGLFCSILISFLLGFFIFYFLFPFKNKNLPWIILVIVLSFGLGFGLSSILFYYWILIFGPTGAGFIFFELLLIFVISIILLFSHKKKKMPNINKKQKNKVTYCLALFLLVLISYFMIFVIATYRNPHGESDAWANWNLKARKFYLGTENYISGGRSDYPPFLSATVARTWKYMGNMSAYAPVAVACLFTFAVPLLIFSTLSIIRGSIQGSLAGIVLLSAPAFVSVGAAQYADIPLSFFMLASVSMFILRNKLGKNSLILAGVFAGLSLWTKNEAIFFLIAVVLTHLVVTVKTKSWKDYFNDLKYLLIGLIPVLLAIVYFKIFIAPDSATGLFQNIRIIFLRLVDLSRLKIVSLEFFKRLFFPNPFYSPPIFSFTLLGIYLLFMGLVKNTKIKQYAIILFLIFAIVLLEYMLVYLAAPKFEWFIVTSLNRLLLHLWPIFVLAFFLLVKTPREALDVDKKLRNNKISKTNG